jgi:hypothetical protein
MRFKTVLIFLFIFVTWYVVYQALFSFFINISFVLAIAFVIWLVRKIRGISIFKSKPKPKHAFYRSAHS